jgi:ferredoxin
MSYVVTADCTACGACLLTCPEHAIVVGLPLRVRDDRCTSCGECVEVCPADAVLEVPPPRAARPPAARPDPPDQTCRPDLPPIMELSPTP